MSQISFSFIRHVTTVVVLFWKKEYSSLKALKEIKKYPAIQICYWLLRNIQGKWYV